MKKALIVSMSILMAASALDAQGYVSNRAPLTESRFIELPIGAVKAEGWLRQQLVLQKDGLTGHLDELYPNVVGSRNAWLGGDGDAWERGPYWIDGLLPLAYLLDDQGLKDKAQVWVEAILGSQQEDGYFGPATDRGPEPGLQRNNSHDWWPKMVALKIVKQYYMATGDERVIPFLDRYFRYQLAHLPETPLDHWTFWGAQRGGDNLEIVYWLYNITGEKYLLELGELIHRQSTPWTDMFLDGSTLYTQNSIHCVNLGQGFKEPVVYWQQSGEQKQLDAVRNAGKVIRKTIGLPTGLWAGDELINFGDPTRGSELCTAVEMMFSLEEMLRITGDLHWAEWLERIAYNALPTQADDRYETRQYFQQTNQIECSRNTSRNFSTPHSDTDQVFGLLNGYPCCTTNMHQGWPKFTQNLWYATDDAGLAALVYAPSRVTAMVAGGIEACVTEETFYPFNENIRFTVSFPDRKVKSAYFPIRFRIPAWCVGAELKVNGERVGDPCGAGDLVTVRRTWAKGDVVTLDLPMSVECSRWFDSSAVIERGPLVYALRMNETWTRKQTAASEKVRYGDWYYEVTSDSPWNFCLSGKTLKSVAENCTVIRNDVDASLYPWTLENAPLSIRIPARPMLDWKAYRGSVGQVQYFTQQGGDLGAEQTIELIPYGCTTLRIAEFPVRQ
ncbi:MAG: glycoside hydrolase family 127 protein [Bacteroidales bacterium]|nr:glycoside hydrolase family 127 protein [Candidatus Cryptobacteroides choladohippi]